MAMMTNVWIKVTDSAKNVHWVNGSRIVRMRQVQGVEKKWTEIHFGDSSPLVVNEQVEEIVGMLT